VPLFAPKVAFKFLKAASKFPKVAFKFPSETSEYILQNDFS